MIRSRGYNDAIGIRQLSVGNDKYRKVTSLLIGYERCLRFGWRLDDCRAASWFLRKGPGVSQCIAVGIGTGANEIIRSTHVYFAIGTSIGNGWMVFLDNIDIECICVA